MHGHRFSCRALVLLLALALAGCAHFPLNQPLDRWNPDAGYRLDNRANPLRSDELLVALSFSGGGTRAAAFAFGVLEALRDIDIVIDGHQRNLLDEVDLMASVSGGSVTAAYYAVHGDSAFEHFETAFLKRDVQGELLRRAATPRNLLRLASDDFERIDLMAEYLDSELFLGRTFGKLERDLPFLMIHATDISLGAPFDFTQDRFDLLCSSLDDFPVARAVAASAAVPVLLSPITLRNFGPGCDYREPDWFKRSEDPQSTPRLRRRVGKLRSYQNDPERPWIHLFDGGLADNLGIYGVLDELFSLDDPCTLGSHDPERLAKLRKVLLIVVNAVTELDRSADTKKEGPSLSQTLWAANSIPIDRHAYQSIDQLRQRLETWASSMVAAGCRSTDGGDISPIDVYPVVVNFESISDETLRRQFLKLPTSLSLDPNIVDDLRHSAADVLARSEVFRSFVEALQR